MKKNKLLIFISLFYSIVISAQNNHELSYENFIAWVNKNHPLIKNSISEKSIAQYNILKARASLDPNISGKIGEKKIDQNLYYNQKSIELNLPTWYGVDFNIGVNDLSGNKLNNEETKGVINNIGINIPLTRNLIYNKRRATIQQAKILNEMTFSEQEMIKNQVLLDANIQYWDWVKNHEILLLTQQIYETNKNRYELIKKTFNLGERPAIDTIEAYSQLQAYELKNIEAKNNFKISTIELSLFLWKENGENYPLPENITPLENLDIKFTEDYFLILERLSTNIEQQNAINYYKQKNKFLELEKKLKWQNFLPKLDFTYNVFNKKPNQIDILPIFDNNFQYGLKLELPIFAREARADYQIAKLKISQNNEALQFKKQEFLVKVKNYDNEIKNYINLTENNKNLEDNLKKLLKAEETRFSNGESSLFLINSRENKLLETQEKITELKAKVIKTYFKINWLENNIIPQ